LLFGLTLPHWVRYFFYGRIEVFLGGFDGDGVKLQEINNCKQYAINLHIRKIFSDQYTGKYAAGK
jgi:hypothetical protein